MRIFSRFAVLLLLMFAGCEESKEPVTIVLEGESKIVADVNEWFQNNPQVAASVLGDRPYTIQIIKPRPEIDYKIGIIRPDPDIDFKIGIIGPYASDEVRKLDEKLGELVRKQMPDGSFLVP